MPHGMPARAADKAYWEAYNRADPDGISRIFSYEHVDAPAK